MQIFLLLAVVAVCGYVYWRFRTWFRARFPNYTARNDAMKARNKAKHGPVDVVGALTPKYNKDWRNVR